MLTTHPLLPSSAALHVSGGLNIVSVRCRFRGHLGGTTGNCISAIIPGGDSHSVILGDNFMRAWYTVYTYDISSKTAYVGIAEAAAMTN